MHVEQVLGNVPKAERCQCNEKNNQAAKASPKKSEVPDQSRSWLRRVLGD